MNFIEGGIGKAGKGPKAPLVFLVEEGSLLINSFIFPILFPPPYVFRMLFDSSHEKKFKLIKYLKNGLL